MSPPPTTPHIVILGTGITALTIARILVSTPSPNLSITLIDKARNPGGRLTSRVYDSGTILETGARVFESSGRTSLFGKEVERWFERGWVKEVDSGRIAGVGKREDGRKWWEGVGGVSKLVERLLEEVRESAKKNEVGFEVKYNVQAANPTPSTLDPLSLTLTPPTALDPISLLISTAPAPQTFALLPPSLLPPSNTPPTPYIKTLSFLLPTLQTPSSFPTYHRSPHPNLSSLATGLSSSGDAIGLVVQARPDQLGVQYQKEESSDEVVKEAFWGVLEESGLLSKEVIQSGKKMGGREAQIKRWKFAQPESVVGVRKEALGMEMALNERVLMAGDGVGKGDREEGGVELGWKSGVEAGEYVKKWLEKQ